MIYKLKCPKYYPLKVRGGFLIARTCDTEKSLGFATFKLKRIAIASGKRWYGKFKGYDKLSYRSRK